MPRLFKKSQKYNVARNCFLARIVLLDKTTIEFNLLPEVTGSDCLEKVAQVMEIQEVSWWSIRYNYCTIQTHLFAHTYILVLELGMWPHVGILTHVLW